MKILINIWIQASGLKIVTMTLAWFILGPIIVFVYMLLMDVFTLFRVLCTYGEFAT